MMYVALLVLVVLLGLTVVNTKVLREYERGVIFRLGRCIGQKGPGLIFLIPIIVTLNPGFLVPSSRH